MSADHELRRVAEESMDDLLRRYDRVPVIMMCLRVLDAEARYESEIENADDLRKNPDGSDWINLLGDLFHGRHDESQNVQRNARKLCRRLAEELERQDEGTHVCGILKSDQVNPVWRLADALITLMTRNNQNKNYNKALDSCLMLNQPHGVARKRQISNRGVGPGGRRTSDARSAVLSNTMLDFLVHRYLRKSAKGRKSTSLSFQQFLRVLRTQYGTVRRSVSWRNVDSVRNSPQKSQISRTSPARPRIASRSKRCRVYENVKTAFCGRSGIG